MTFIFTPHFLFLIPSQGSKSDFSCITLKKHTSQAISCHYQIQFMTLSVFLTVNVEIVILLYTNRKLLFLTTLDYVGLFYFTAV